MDLQNEVGAVADAAAPNTQEPAQGGVQTPVEPKVSTTQEPASTEVSPKSDTTVPADPETASKEPSEPSTGESVAEDVKYSEGAQFNGKPVEVTIPADLINFGNEHNLDIQALSKELYSSEDFTLSEESLNAAYEAFGKWQVDTYLSGLKASNLAMLNEHEQTLESRAAAEKEAWDATMEIMGGEDRWDDLSSYAASSLSDAEIEEFNKVMQEGSLKMQQLMIKDLYSKFTEAGAPAAPTVLDLEEGNTGGDPLSGNEALSSSQFLELMKSGEYKNNPEKYDRLRRAGIAKGI